ncbi:enoyl-CoA hydratase [Niveispirillum sp. SYP-B3756]|uniref:crotonase/enoyl-CoA hydratase family protein n=1 Tax=Niveispirillum sp. SYP-B3756 TaxID=2662178 RepID=UPI001290EAAA|nr:crotonase/enoyl-CoA hydratase family protein [Niveispirillum sp. SYP-B3756]MQP68290.1 enoyl-CoA hydratase [Niveispirillum sp. SYP-B3756]
MTGEYQTICYEVGCGIATVTLNRPQSMNSINPIMVRELLQAFDATDADDTVRVVILTGTGERAFCAGADITAGAATFDYAQREGALRPDVEPDGNVRDAGGLVALRIFNSLKPVIAAINGAAVGAGATIPLAADLRLAATTARFGYVFARRGIVPESASGWFLPRIVGISTALEWCLSGRLVPATEALERGLVRSVHPPGELLAAAREIAREIVENAAPVSVALTRQMLWRMLGASHPMEAHRLDSWLVQSMGPGPDAHEGVAAFLEKRLPAFGGRVSTDMPDPFPWWTEPGFQAE